MLLKLAALGALGYAGYKVYEKNSNGERRNLTGRSDRSPPVAGGPLSNDAKVVRAGQTV
jgi:uncharacterized membrane protein YebE (DUF533 family)